MTSNMPVNIVVAHALEARPLIDLLKLKKQAASGPFNCYENQSGCALIVSGMGKINAASAVAYLAGLQTDSSSSREKGVSRRDRGWLNIGIAGHKSTEPGIGLLATKIRDRNSTCAEYPSMILASRLSSQFASVWNRDLRFSEVVTVDQPELEYPEDVAYEMEALGFFSMAKKFASSELVQLFKIVSDNSQSKIEHISTASIMNSFAKHSEFIMALLQALAEQVSSHNAIDKSRTDYASLAASVKLSRTQQSQLQRLCQRYTALAVTPLTNALSMAEIHCARDLLTNIERLIASNEP